MPVNLATKRRLLARVSGVGQSRIHMDPEYLSDIADTITRAGARGLITAGIITIKPAGGTSRGRAKIKREQRRKRGIKPGSKQGRKKARTPRKKTYVAKVRALRRLLKISKARQEISNPEFWSLYKRVGGNTVRNKAHLRKLIEETVSKRD